MHPMYRSRKEFPREKVAGATFGEAWTGFQDIHDDQILKEGEVLGPFTRKAKWELVKWLMKNVGHNQVEEFLKLSIVSLYPFDMAWKYSQHHFDFADSRMCGPCIFQQRNIPSHSWFFATWHSMEPRKHQVDGRYGWWGGKYNDRRAQAMVSWPSGVHLRVGGKSNVPRCDEVHTREIIWGQGRK